ncbi:uncharacterized protein LOC113347462 [Papaver somniferum]|uniref:uncharacterized protein LOC113347462 n=1 Tax=Papaver somniferum TaxID=3469 RepID=UPI000E6FEE98|nr:uncharacterized protein LOC113347462 [Papaver somniferum]
MATKEKLQEISNIVTQHTDSISEMKTEIQSLGDKMNLLIHLFQSAQSPQPGSENQQPNPGNPFTDLHQVIHNFSNTESRKFTRTPKVDFPRFNGINPRGWAPKCDRYFSLHKFPDDERVDMAANHFDSAVDSWFLNYQQGKEFISWDTFKHDLCARFEDVAHDNYVGSFNKLAQTTTVEDYYDLWEHYKSFMIATYIPESFYTLSFISGLKEEICTVVQMFKPKNTATSFYLARLQEASLHHHPKPTKSFSRPFVRKDKGLCYNCDEFYRQGHICKTQQLFMIIADEDLEDHGSLSTEEISDASPSTSDSTIEISLHALTGNIAHDTIRISGHLKKHPVVLLMETVPSARVFDNVSTRKCKDINFSANLRVLPLGRCDIVLGADWLRQLGDVTFNFSQLSISFIHQGNPITLQGTSSKPSPSRLTASSLKKFIKSNTPTLICQFFSISTTPVLPPPPAISALLDTFSDVFAEPTGLPPSRSLDHQIPLKTGSNPTSQRPYKCPYVHRSVVESLVSEMLSSGVIQPSHSPFAAPILLVKKKDETRRFCVDYRKLNDIIVKDKFPIPLIEELLDELNDFMPKLEYLGHIITANGVAADPDEVAAMVNWPPPQTLKKLRGFL